VGRLVQNSRLAGIFWKDKVRVMDLVGRAALQEVRQTVAEEIQAWQLRLAAMAEMDQ
jgi:hypothetical protein